MAHDVFISHSNEDKALADATCAALEAAGLRCWIAPRDILAGRDWASSIADAIRGARVMVLIYSVNSVDSEHVKKELTLGVESSTIIVPLRIADVPLSGMMQYYLSGTHWLDAMDPPSQHEISLLVDTVKSLLSGATHLEHLAEGGVGGEAGAAVAGDAGAMATAGAVPVTAPFPTVPSTPAIPAPMGTTAPPPAQPPMQPQPPMQSPPPMQPQAPMQSPPSPKRSKLPIILAVLAVCGILFIILGVVVVRAVVNRLDDTPVIDTSVVTDTDTSDTNSFNTDPGDTTDPGTPVPGPSVTTPSSSTGAYLTLVWNNTDDLDIDVYNGDTGDYIGSSFDMGGHDSQNGTTGQEYLDLSLTDQNLLTSDSLYIVISNMSTVQQEWVDFTLTVTAADGTSRDFVSRVTGIPPNDIWIVCRIDRDSGQVLEEVGEYSEVTQE